MITHFRPFFKTFFRKECSQLLSLKCLSTFFTFRVASSILISSAWSEKKCLKLGIGAFSSFHFLWISISKGDSWHDLCERGCSGEWYGPHHPYCQWRHEYLKRWYWELEKARIQLLISNFRINSFLNKKLKLTCVKSNKYIVFH